MDILGYIGKDYSRIGSCALQQGSMTQQAGIWKEDELTDPGTKNYHNARL
jgi:hypothetical protein